MVPSVFVRTKLVCFMPVAADMLWFANAPYPYGSSPVHSICTQTRIHIVMFSFIVAITLPMVKWLSTTLLLSVTIKTAPAAPRGKLKSRTQIVTCMLMCDIGAVKEWGKNNSRKCQHFMILNSSLPNRTLHVSHSAKTNQIPPSLSHALPPTGPRTSATQSPSRGTHLCRASTTTWPQRSCSSWTTTVGEAGYPNSLIGSWTNLRWLLCEEGSARGGMDGMRESWHSFFAPRICLWRDHTPKYYSTCG